MPFKTSGDVILGYTLDGDPQPSGQSHWAFARKGRKAFFIKQFLSPVQPARSDAGSKATFERRKAAADRFEKRHEKLNSVGKKSGISNNLVLPISSGWVEGKYTKIFPRVNAVNVRVKDVSKQPEDKRAFVMLQLAEALQSLHDNNIVHSDIKWTNILFERLKGNITPKLIDFDAGYDLSDRPLDPDDLTFDAPYAAPEIWKFVRSGKEGDGTKIGLHSDIFSLGVLFHEIACGSKPLGDASTYYGRHLLSYAPSLKLTSRSVFFELISSMLKYEIEERPNIGEVVVSLSKILGHEVETSAIEKPAPVMTPWSKGTTAAVEHTRPPPTPRSTPPSTTTSGGLKGMLKRALSFGRKESKPLDRSEGKAATSSSAAGALERGVEEIRRSLPEETVAPKVKVSSSFASDKIAERSEGRLKMTMSNRPDVEVKRIIKATTRVELPKKSKLKTTIRR